MTYRPVDMRPLSLALLLLTSTTLSLANITKGIAAPAAQTRETPTARPQLAERSVENAEALARQLHLREQQQLIANETFLALWRPANLAEAKGLVILLPGMEQSADWPSVISPLRRQLPNSGWSTLSLTLPDSDERPLPKALLTRSETETETEKPETAQEPEADTEPNTETTSSPTADQEIPVDNSVSEPPRITEAERISARLQAALAFAKAQQTPRIVLLGYREGAYWAARFIQEHPAENLDLVIIEALQPEGSEPELSTLIPPLKRPTADLFYRRDEAATLRLQASQRLAHPGYSQRLLPTLTRDSNSDNTRLVRRVRGWLEAPN